MPGLWPLRHTAASRAKAGALSRCPTDAQLSRLVGELRETSDDVLVVPGADLRMVTYTAVTGSSDAGKLDLLRVTGGRTADPQAAR